MATKLFTLDDLKRILLQAAGAEEGVDLDGDILDTPFDVLGYESLALLETGGFIEREYEHHAGRRRHSRRRHPRALIDAVNAQLAPVQAA